MAEPFPFSIEDVNPVQVADFYNLYKCKHSSLVQVGPTKVIMDSNFRKYADIYYNLELRPDDVFIMGFHRSGTTLLQEMVWMLVNNFDFEKAKSMRGHERVPLLESNSRDIDEIYEKLKTSIPAMKSYIDTRQKSLQILQENPGRRVVKSHLPFQFLPKLLLSDVNRKVIYIARNPKDVIISLYKFEKSLPGWLYGGSFSAFYENFKRDQFNCMPYWDHVEQLYKQRNLPNVKFVFYEDVIKNVRQTIVELSNFLNVELSVANLDLLERHLKIDNFKKYMDAEEGAENISLINKDNTEGRKTYFPENSEILIDVDKWIAKNAKKIGIHYT